MTEVAKQYRHLDYEVLIHKDKYSEASRWCRLQFGLRWEAIGYREGRWSLFWAGRNQPDQYRFCFALEKDMIWFKLKWQ